MTDDRVSTLLREANPAPTRHVASRPSAGEMLSIIRSDGRPVGTATERNPLMLVAVAAGFVAAVLAVVAVLPFGGEPVQRPTATLPPTTSTSTSPPTTTSAIDPNVRLVLDAFADRYSTGDVRGVVSLIAPGTSKQIQRDAEPIERWAPERTEYQIAVDAALNTRLTIEDCRPLQSGSVACNVARDNDLTRIAGIEPQVELVTFRVEDGALTVWLARQGFHATPYQTLAIAPFTEWLSRNHPEIDDPHPLVGGVSYWRPDRPILDVLADLVDEYGASLEPRP